MKNALLAIAAVFALVFGAAAAFLLQRPPQHTAALPTLKENEAAVEKLLTKEIPSTTVSEQIIEVPLSTPNDQEPISHVGPPGPLISAPAPRPVTPPPAPPINPPRRPQPAPDTVQAAPPPVRRAAPPADANAVNPADIAPEPVIPVATAREALSLVGADPLAEAVWFQAINDPALSDKVREDLIEDLNEEGFANPKRPSVEELPLIVNRLAIIEQLAPDSMDENNYKSFMEAYKDLTNMFNRLTRQ